LHLYTKETMQAPSVAPSASSEAPSATEPDGESMRELHGRRLHGFALLVTLGDQPLAGRLAADALAADDVGTTELSRPALTAALLRRAVLRLATHREADLELDQVIVGMNSPVPPVDGPAALESLRVDARAFAALRVLGIRQRAAIVATFVERLAPRDVATIVELDGARLESLVRDALHLATSAADANLPDQSTPDGPVVRRMRKIAARTLA
jgi:DNA-directed RNA polymerase specialized sigma24 family protein